MVISLATQPTGTAAKAAVNKAEQPENTANDESQQALEEPTKLSEFEQQTEQVQAHFTDLANASEGSEPVALAQQAQNLAEQVPPEGFGYQLQSSSPAEQLLLSSTAQASDVELSAGTFSQVNNQVNSQINSQTSRENNVQAIGAGSRRIHGFSAQIAPVSAQNQPSQSAQALSSSSQGFSVTQEQLALKSNRSGSAITLPITPSVSVEHSQSSTANKVFSEASAIRLEPSLVDLTLSERSQTTTGRYEWAAVKVDAQQQNWSKQLVNVLQDRIQMQASQHIKQVNIRLDPPDMGRLEINIRSEGDKMSVTLSANNHGVKEALLANSDRLGSELSEQFGAGVDVNVSDDSLEDQLKESEEQVALSIEEENHQQQHTPLNPTNWLNRLA